MRKFKIGQSVYVRSCVRARGTAHTEYRIVRQLPFQGVDQVILYRVRSSADEREEIVVKESELLDCGNFNRSA
jgi:hypothetical protein